MPWGSCRQTWRREGCPPLPHHLVCVEKFTLPYHLTCSGVQERLRCDFDIAALRATLSADRCWQIMADYRDKLEHQTPTDLPTSPH